MREKKSIPITIFTKRICIEYCFATKIIHLKLANEAQFPTLHIRGNRQITELGLCHGLNRISI